MALWLAAHRIATGQNNSSIVARALVEYRDRISVDEAELPVMAPGQRRRPVEGRRPVRVELPPDVLQWLRVHCAWTGRSGDSVVEQALIEHRARVEHREPCGQH